MRNYKRQVYGYTVYVDRYGLSEVIFNRRGKRVYIFHATKGTWEFWHDVKPDTLRAGLKRGSYKLM